MASTLTTLPAPRVDFIDPRTGLMAREWYLFFLNLLNLANSNSADTSLDELKIGPPDYPIDLIAVQNLISDSLGVPPPMPQDMTLTKSNQVLLWLSMQ